MSPMLSFTTVLDGTNFSAASHQEMISDSLRGYERISSDVNYIVADNCSTNKALAIVMGVPLIGCASHRFNLAVGQYLKSFDVGIGNISERMKLLRGPKRRANLRSKTTLQPFLCNDTRWSSTFSMIRRYFELEQDLDTDDPAVVEKMLDPLTKRQMKTLLDGRLSFFSRCYSVSSKGRTRYGTSQNGFLYSH